MVKHIQTIRRQLPTNFLTVFNYFVGLVLKELTKNDRCATENFFFIYSLNIKIDDYLNY